MSRQTRVDVKQIGKIKISEALYSFLSVLSKELPDTANSPEKICADLEALDQAFYQRGRDLLKRRDALQVEINEFFDEQTNHGKKSILVDEVVKKLRAIDYIVSAKNQEPVSTNNVAAELNPLAGPQLVVPADKVNMVLNASNARWGSLYKALYTSNIIETEVREQRQSAVVQYTSELLDQLLPLESGCWTEDVTLILAGDGLYITGSAGKVQLKNPGQFLGVSPEGSGYLLLFKNNNLGIKLKVGSLGEIEDVLLESALTYIIDLEDASISTPQSKLEGYRIVRGIIKGDLECEVRGKTRKMLPAEVYKDLDSGNEFEVSSSAVALVRDVGLHLLVDEDLLSIDGRTYSEKILDCYMTSLCGARYHVAPKMHGAEEVAYTYELFEAINELQAIAPGSNKIGIMNEEVRTTAQLGNCIAAAEQVVFFTNTGFLDYTGSYIDLMMHQGPIAPYRDLPGKTYKESYEIYNVNESLVRRVPQIGAGMWAKVRDMKGLMASKKEQVEGCTDTGWSPSPTAATLHALAFHLHGEVRGLQADYLKKLPEVTIESLFEFPRADLTSLSHGEIIENLDFAVHGLLAYAEPWVRRGIGCSAVMELSAEPLMEDRATARIKAAFVRNWLLHGVISEAEVNDSITRMVALVNSQNRETEAYQALALEGDPVVEAVEQLIFNPKQYQHSYVEFYFYEANRKANGGENVYNARLSS